MTPIANHGYFVYHSSGPVFLSSGFYRAVNAFTYFDTVSCYAAPADLKLQIFTCQPPSPAINLCLSTFPTSQFEGQRVEAILFMTAASEVEGVGSSLSREMNIFLMTYQHGAFSSSFLGSSSAFNYRHSLALPEITSRN